MELLKKHKAWFMVAAGVLLAAATWAATAQDPAAPPPSPLTKFEEAIPAAAELKNLALKYDGRLGTLEQQLQEGRKALGALQEALGTLASRIEELRQPAPVLPKPEPPPPAKLTVLDLARPAAKSVHVPAGSFGEATLLTGVYAPITGDALPVLVRLDAVLTGPNRTRVPLQGAFLIGKAVGDANTSRATVQLNTLSVGSLEKQVNGYVVDADGIQGLRGEYLWNGGQLVGLSAISGAATGASSALGQSQTSTFVGPGVATREVTRDAGLFVGASSASRAFENIGKVIEERLKEFVPAIYVSNKARRVTVVFLQGATLEGFEPPAQREYELGGFDR